MLRIVRRVLYNDLITLSIPSRMLLYSCPCIDYFVMIFQFLLGCFNGTETILVDYDYDHFQFLLGCFQITHVKPLRSTVLIFQFLLGCFTVDLVNSLCGTSFFQFLLGCFHNNDSNILSHPGILLSIPSRMLPSVKLKKFKAAVLELSIPSRMLRRREANV